MMMITLRDLHLQCMLGIHIEHSFNSIKFKLQTNEDKMLEAGYHTDLWMTRYA